MKVKKEDLLNSLPPPWPEDLLPVIREQVAASQTKLVVLDDDPTGTQTVHDLPVLTEWSVSSLTTVLHEPGSTVYLLTNSRSVPLAEAQAMNREIAANLQAASRASGCRVAVVSRSDSTLRGHYPGEVTALVEALGQKIDGTLIIPFFLEGGRLTINDTHYVAEGDWLIPAAETEYARDATFGYQHANLREWVLEKHHDHLNTEQVTSISLSALRTAGPAAVAAQLAQIRNGQVCVVNAATYRDLEVFVAGLLQAEAQGRRFIYRTAASFVRVRGGIPPRNLLTGTELDTAGGEQGGLVIAGSYIQKSSQQIEAARALPTVTGLEVAVDRLLDQTGRTTEIERVSTAMNDAIAAGQDVLVYTSRRLITGPDAESSLQIGQLVSAALVKIVRNLTQQPAWIIAKGGITSSDVATKGLGVKRAQVLGQAIPGVPTWRTGSESRWPGLVYVVFPGNVGGPEAIAQMIQILRGEYNV